MIFQAAVRATEKTFLAQVSIWNEMLYSKLVWKGLTKEKDFNLGL